MTRTVPFEHSEGHASAHPTGQAFRQIPQHVMSYGVVPYLIVKSHSALTGLRRGAQYNGTALNAYEAKAMKALGLPTAV